MKYELYRRDSKLMKDVSLGQFQVVTFDTDDRVPAPAIIAGSH